MRKAVLHVPAVTPLLLCGFVSAYKMPAFGSAEKSFSRDPQGLEKQFEPFLKAAAKPDVPAATAAFNVFAFPKPERWFGQYFAKDQVQQLVWDDEAEVRQYEKVLFMMMGIAARGQRFRAKAKAYDSAASAALKPRADAVVPLMAVPVEQFEVSFVAVNGKSFSQVANFVFAAGAYRYVGRGAYPFWSMPDANRKV